MSVQDDEQLWGGETTKAVENFPVSGERVPVAVVRWLGRIKGAAARANADLGLLDAELAERIAAAGDEIAARRARRPVPDRRLPDRLGHLVEHERQRGHREPRRRGRPRQRPRQHGPVVQRRLPVSAVHLAALDEATNPLLPALERLEASLRRQGRGVRRHRQVRPHAPDGRRPGHARPGVRRLRRADPPRPRARRATRSRRSRQIPLGGTATGTGLNTHPEFAEPRCARACSADTGLTISRARGPVRGAGQPRRAGRAVGRAEGRRRLADEDRQRPRADGLRPARRHRRAASCPSCRRARRSCRARSTR